MSRETIELIKRIASERNISVEVLEEAIEAALISASRKMLDPELDIKRAFLDPKLGEYRVVAEKMVVASVVNDAREISIQEARLYDTNAQIGKPIEIDVTPNDFGRIAAQNAKQVVTQRIREAERQMVFERYSGRIGDLVSGTVQQYERRNVIVDIGYAEAVLPFDEQPRGEKYKYGDRVRAIIIKVDQSNRDAQVILSRKTPELVRRLFEQEVSEVRDGTVIIKGVAREPGKRAKIAVMSTNLDVDPVGACVGVKGSRVQMVVQELRGERIDIIPYSQDKVKFIKNALKPAEVESVELDPDGTRATIIVKDDQHSLAIGANHLNKRLASQLTGVRITSIVKISEIEASEREARENLSKLPGCTDEMITRLMGAGILSYQDVVDYGVGDLVRFADLDEGIAEKLVDAATRILEGKPVQEMEENVESDQAVGDEINQPEVMESASDQEAENNNKLDS